VPVKVNAEAMKGWQAAQPVAFAGRRFSSGCYVQAFANLYI
jgi:hypothetical protein